MSDALRLRTEGVEWRDVGGEIVILDMNASQYLALNGTGARLWKALEAGTPSEVELVSLLRRSFEVDEERAKIDVRTFIAQLREAQLLEE